MSNLPNYFENNHFLYYSEWVGASRSLTQRTTGCTPGIRTPAGEGYKRFSVLQVQTGPRTHPASCKIRTWGSSQEEKRPGRSVGQPTPSSAEVKRV